MVKYVLERVKPITMSRQLQLDTKSSRCEQLSDVARLHIWRFTDYYFGCSWESVPGKAPSMLL